MASIDPKFDAAVTLIKSLPKDGPFQPSYGMMKKFYGLFKQATIGPCNEPKPGFWEAVKRTKWEAWSALGNMTKEDAMRTYVDEMLKIMMANANAKDLPHLMQIVETMPHTDDVGNFMEIMGPFFKAMEEMPKKNKLLNGRVPDEEENRDVPSLDSGGEKDDAELTGQAVSESTQILTVDMSKLACKGANDIGPSGDTQSNESHPILVDPNSMHNKTNGRIHVGTSDGAHDSTNSRLHDGANGGACDSTYSGLHDGTSDGIQDSTDSGLHDGTNGGECDSINGSSHDGTNGGTCDSTSGRVHYDTNGRVHYSTNGRAHDTTNGGVHNSSISSTNDSSISDTHHSSIGVLHDSSNVGTHVSSDSEESESGSEVFCDSMDQPALDTLPPLVNQVQRLDNGPVFTSTPHRQQIITQAEVHNQQITHSATQPIISNGICDFEGAAGTRRGGGEVTSGGKGQGARGQPRNQGSQDETGGRRRGSSRGNSESEGRNTGTSGGSSGGRGPGRWDRVPADVSEQIATALERLQRDMNSVLIRLNTLEALALSRQQMERENEFQSGLSSAISRSPRHNRPWWLFRPLPRASMFVLLVWPLIVHWLLTFLSKRRRHLRRF